MSSMFNDEKVDRHIVALDRLIACPDMIEDYKECLRTIRHKAATFRHGYKSKLTDNELHALWVVKTLIDSGVIRV